MKILINTASTYKGGGVQVAQSFLEECQQFRDHEYHVVLGEMIAELIDTNRYPSNFFFYKIGYRPATRVLGFKSQSEFFEKLEQKVNPDVVFTTSGPAYWRPHAPHVVGYNLPHYVYKDSPFFNQISFWKKKKWALKGAIVTHFFKKEADAYVVQTDDVNERLQPIVKSHRVYTVSNTYNQHYEHPRKFGDKLHRQSDQEFRFLILSAWHAHKNLEIIPTVIKALPEAVRERVRFVVTLPEEDFKRSFSDKLGEHIINVGPIRPEEGPSLYKECDALFLPTLLECFSATYAEAMKMGKPIITSDLGFAHTVCGDAALYADPVNPNEWAARIIQLINDSDLRQTLIQNGREEQKKFLSARQRAERYLDICRKVVKADRNKDRKIVVVNQAVNYLTVGLCNAFTEEFGQVDLITGSIHEQGESLKKSVRVTKMNTWVDRPSWKKMLSYVWGCLRIYTLLLTRYRKHDVFFMSLPPMAYLLSIVLPNRCSMLIWDVYPDVFKITGMTETNLLYKTWAKLNKIAFKKAHRVYTIGVKMAELLANYVDREKIQITPIWSIFQSNGKVEKENNPFVLAQQLQDKFVVQYSGNIGLTHNVETMIALAEKMKDHDDILFQIIGRGTRVPHLKALVKEKNLLNCQFLPFQSDEMFPYSLSAADIGVVILDEATSKGSVPSKSYNLMSYGIPALYIAGEDSELYDYAVKYQHAKCVSSSNLQEAANFILSLKSDCNLREKYAQNAVKASQNYRRSNADKIVEYYLA
ncbi:glycosyltransferase [Fodinibius sp. N2]|uniref:glycosyltransferase n=1 Tax=Fodinibius alkaliphilus TaxID=3140241 RepID=UPI00315A57D4